MTVSSSPGPAGSAPPAAQAPPPRGLQPFFAARPAPSSPRPQRAGPSPPVPGRVRQPGTRCSRCGETFLGAALELRLLGAVGGEGGGDCVLTSPCSRESLLPPTPSPLGPELSFVFQARGTRWLLGPYPLVGGAAGLGELAPSSPLAPLPQRAASDPSSFSVVRVPFQSIKFRWFFSFLRMRLRAGRKTLGRMLQK